MRGRNARQRRCTGGSISAGSHIDVIKKIWSKNTPLSSPAPWYSAGYIPTRSSEAASCEVPHRPKRQDQKRDKHPTRYNRTTEEIPSTYQGVEKVLEVFPLLDSILGDQVVELHQHHGHQVRHLRQPRHLLSGLKVSVRHERAGQPRCLA